MRNSVERTTGLVFAICLRRLQIPQSDLPIKIAIENTYSNVYVL